MSENTQSNEQDIPEEQQIDSTMVACDITSSALHALDNALYEKSQSLIDIANNTFKQLSHTLEEEQAKILELEKRRHSLQEEMLHLKEEIEAEMQTYNLHLQEHLEVDDGEDDAGSHDDPAAVNQTESLVNVAQKIKHGLQNVVSELSLEREQLLKAVNNHGNLNNATE